MKIFVLLTLLAVFALVGCTAAVEEASDGAVEINEDEDSIKMDTNDNDVADVEVKNEGDYMEVKVDMDDVQDDATKDAMEKASGNEDFCVEGSTFEYSSAEGSVDSIVIGLETYKGKEFCKAESVSEIDSQVGKIVTKSIYYFDNTYKEYWVITEINNPMMPEPQTTEIHLIDGKVA